jgi:signal peptidase II
LDQVAKLAVFSAIGPSSPDRRDELGISWLALEYTENRGVAFGLLGSVGPWLAIASLAVLAGLLAHYASASSPSLWETVAVGAIAGGAIGNLIDRVRLGYVVDFIAVGAWPNFNVADSAITIGVILFLFGWLIPHGEPGISGGLSKESIGSGSKARSGESRARQ